MYRTTNLITNKFYIGVHSTYNLLDGYLGSGKRLKRAIKKYGKENFKIEILEFFETRDEVLKREKEIVNEQLLNDSNCMNLQPGGGGGFTKEQSTKGAINANKKRKWLYQNDEEYRLKIRSYSIKNLKNRTWKDNFVWAGKTHTNETKKKIGEKNSQYQKGEGNSQFGTCWINNTIECKKIKREELNNWIKLGWKKGRKIDTKNSRRYDT